MTCSAAVIRFSLMAFAYGGVSSAALAAEPPSAAGASDTAQSAPQGGDGQLQEIVVTAQRRAENLQRAALAVTAVSSEELTRANVTDTAGLTRVAPALQIANVFGPTNGFYLRGVGNFVTNSLSDSAIVVNLDGVPLGRPTGSQGLFFDLERIEVLKGPQGTLYGRNATGGAINVIATKPKFDEFSGYANASYGNYNALVLSGAVNVPLSSAAAFRVAGQWTRQDGTYSDGSGDDDTKTVRATLALRPTDDLKITLGGHYTQMGGVGPGGTVVGFDPDARLGLHSPQAQAQFASALSFPAGAFLNPLQTARTQNNRFWGLYAQVDVETPLGSITILPAFRHSTLNYLTDASGFASINRESDDQFSVEARLVSPADKRLQYIFGAFFFHEDNTSKTNQNQQYFGAWYTITPKTDSYAAYGRLTYKLTDQFRLNVGARYTIDRRTANLSAVNAAVVCPTLPALCLGANALPVQLDVPSSFFAAPGVLLPAIPNGGGSLIFPNAQNLNLAKTFRRFTWRAGVEYDVGPNSLLYATYETGYKAGGFFVSIDNPVFDPETISAYTIGSKNRFLSNHLQVNLEAFLWNYNNQQISYFRTDSGGGIEFATANIGRSRIKGVELETRAQVFPNTSLNATIQYLDARNTDFVYSASARVGPPVTGCAVSGPTAGSYRVDCSNKRPTNAPEWTISAGIEQRISLGTAGQVRLNAQTRYQSGSYTGIALLQSGYQKGYWMTDLQAEFSPVDQRFTLAAWVNNLENSNVYGFTQPHPQAPSLVTGTLRLPRTYGIRAGVKF